MQTFTQVLKTEEENFLHFTFDCIVTPHLRKCQISVLTRGPQKYQFVMEEKYDCWKILQSPKPPEWILALESRLEEIIQKNI
jgi:hypothetical protein